MTCKSLKMSNIIPLTMVYLLLQAIVVIAKINWNATEISLSQVPLKTNRSINKAWPVVDLLNDRTFTILTRLSTGRKSLASDLSIQLIGPNITSRDCVISDLKVTLPVKRLSNKTVLVLADEHDEMGIKLVLVNTKNCKYAYAYNVSLPRRDHMIFTSDNSSDERFVVIMFNKQHCQGHEVCRLLFDPLFRKLEPLDFDFDFPLRQLAGIAPVKSLDEDRFIVHFIEDIGTYRTRMYDLSNNRVGPLYREMLAIDGYITTIAASKSPYDQVGRVWYTALSSGLSWCWQTKRLKTVKTVYCSRFREDGSLIFNRSIVYSDVMSIIDITTIPNGLILFSKKTNCRTQTDECSVLRATVITPDFQNIDCNGCSDLPSTAMPLRNEWLLVKHRQYNTKCDAFLSSVIRMKVRNNHSNDSFQVQYLCVNHDGYFMNGVFSID